MKAAEIILRARSLLGDNQEPFLWSNADLVNYLNDVVDELAEKLFLIKDSTTESVTQITPVVGTKEYALDGSVIRIERAKITTESKPLNIAREDAEAYLDSFYPTWEEAENDTPTLLIEESERGKLWLYPPPDSTNKVNLVVYRRPLSSERILTSALGSSPVIPSWIHRHISTGMLKHAYIKDDIETRNDRKAQEWEYRFESAIEEMKISANKRRQSNKTLSPLEALT